jgi:predicted dehydrogenase
MTRRAAVVGTSFGARIHLPALRGAGFEVVALVGRDLERTRRRTERFGVPHACASLTEALELGLDAVSLATPPATHAPLALEAIAAGCHVLCEKPFTLDAAEARAVERATAEAGVVGYIGHEFRFSPSQSVIEWAIGEGQIGTPVLALSTSFLSMLSTVEMSPWWYDPAQGGGWLGASGSHRIDCLLQWFGPVEAVSAGLSTVSSPPIGVEDTFNVRCRTRSGVEASLVQSAAAAGPGMSITRVLGTAGTLWSQGETVMLADQDAPEGRAVEAPNYLALPAVEGDPAGRLQEMTRQELPPYISLARAFLRAINQEAQPPGARAATFSDGVVTMEVLDAIRQSSASGGTWIPAAEGDRR